MVMAFSALQVVSAKSVNDIDSSNSNRRPASDRTSEFQKYQDKNQPPKLFVPNMWG